MFLLQTGVPTGEPTLPPREPPERFEQLAQLVERWTGSELVGDIVGAAVGPAVEVVAIVVVAYVVDRLVRRGIRRFVEEMKEPRSSADGKRRVLRAGFVNEGRTPSVSARRKQRADALGGLGRSIITVLVWATAALMILGTFGISLAPLVASAGIVGIAVGFGAQDLVRDFLSGVFMLLEDQYGVGDIIDVGEAVGVVEGISLRSTELRSLDGTLWHVPNGEIRRVGNMSQEFSRVVLDVAVAYQTDVQQASSVILAAANGVVEDESWEDWVLAEPELWGVEELGDSGITIRLVVKVAPGEQWQLARDLRRRIKADLADSDIEIPFPQRTVWVRTGAAADPQGVPTPQSSRESERRDGSRP